MNDLDLSEVCDIPEDNNINLSDFETIGDETLDHSTFSSTAATNVQLWRRKPSPRLVTKRNR